MEKTPRYTQRERNMVLGYAAQYKDVIENKRTDAESNRKKDEVWRQIAKEFNARVYHQRSSKQLRQLYKNMKLLLKKDLCGEGKGNRTFMDLLNTLSQQESVAQYISEQMSPNGYSSSRQQKYEDDYDDSKLNSVCYDAMDTDVIVIKSEDISDNEHSQNGGNMDDMDDDDDDCLSNKGIPEVCLEEEDDEIFATDLRQSAPLQSSGRQGQQSQVPINQPEVTIQNVGGIRVGSIGSLANLKALQNSNNSALSISHSNNNNNSNNNVGNNQAVNANNNNNNSSSHNLRSQLTPAEQMQQQLLLNGLGLSAVHPLPDIGAPPPTLPSSLSSSSVGAAAALPALLRGVNGTHNGNSSNSRASPGGNNNNNNNNHHNNNNSLNHSSNNNNHNHNSIRDSINQLLMNYNTNNNNSNNNNNYTHTRNGTQLSGSGSGHGMRDHGMSTSGGSGSGSGGSGGNRNDYLMTLAIEERKLKLDLLQAQIEYWKTLTKKLDANASHNPLPACPCHFPGKVNGLQTQTSSS